MTRKSGIFKPVAGRNPDPPNEQDRPVNEQHNNPATVDEFEREHMGIAAKE